MELFEYIDVLNKPFDVFTTQKANGKLHWHYYCEILHIKKGKLHIICNDYDFILEKHDLCYIYPLQLHEAQIIEDFPVEYDVIKFDIHTINLPQAYVQKIYDYFLTRSSENDFCIIVRNFSEKNLSYGKYIEDIILEYNTKENLYMLQIQANIFSLLIAILREKTKIETPPNQYCGNNFSFHNILEYIDVHSSEEINIQELANKCNMSYSHFARIFKKNYSRTCQEYITYIRLNKADELLMHTNYDIAYISTEVGFFDSSHFIHAYKKWKGITPKQQKLKYILTN